MPLIPAQSRMTAFWCFIAGAQVKQTPPGGHHQVLAQPNHQKPGPGTSVKDPIDLPALLQVVEWG